MILLWFLSLRISTAELARMFQTRMRMLWNRQDVIDQLGQLGTANFPDVEKNLAEPRVAVGIDGSISVYCPAVVLTVQYQ